MNEFGEAGRGSAYKHYAAAKRFGERFQFPLEDDKDLAYKGKIIFTASKFETQTLSNIAGLDDLLGSSVGRFASDIVQGVADTVKGLVDYGGSGDPEVDRKAANQAANSQIKALKGEQKVYQSPLPTRIGSKRKVRLYLPGSIQFTDQIGYTNIDLGILGASAAAGLASNMNAAQLAAAAGGGVVNFFSDVQQMFTGLATSEAAQVAALRVAGKLNTGVQGAIETTTGIALNPNKRASLRGPELRTFRFAFKLIPNSAAEAREIKNIIQFFREEMYPDANDDFGVSSALRFPSKFDISMWYDNKRVATKILPCYLTSVDVVYNASGMSFHRDGSPQEIDISLQFMEERTLTKRDILPEFNADGVGY